MTIDSQNHLGEKSWVIYSLIDPRDGRVRYIGKTINPKKRLSVHISRAMVSKNRSYRLNWVRRLIYLGVRPVFVILETGVGPRWIDSEKRWIRIFKDAGARLVNETEGGEGTDGYIPSPEIRAKISMALRGRTFSSEHIKNLSRARNGRAALSPEALSKLLDIFRSPEHRMKLSLSHRGIPKSPEHRAKISAIHRGKILSIETREKIAACRRGMSLSPEHRLRISTSLRGHLCSPETRAKIAAANHRRIVSQETRAKMSASQSRVLRSPETRAKISAANRIRIISIETRQKMSSSHIGKTLSDEHRAKISAAANRRRLRLEV